MKVLLAMVAALALAGCGVVSEKPLFTAGQAARHPLAEGLWAMSGPGCEVGPLPAGQPLPECAVPITVRGGRMGWNAGAALGKLGGASKTGPLAMASAMPVPSSSPYLLVEGDPLIMQLLEGSSPAADTLAGGGGGDASAPAAAKPSYMALRPLNLNARHEIDRAVLWPIVCPDDPAHAPGFKMVGLECTALNAEAVRGQARHMMPFMSFFMTWVRTQTP